MRVNGNRLVKQTLTQWDLQCESANLRSKNPNSSASVQLLLQLTIRNHLADKNTAQSVWTEECSQKMKQVNREESKKKRDRYE